jgi:hypothetical protein
MKNAEPLHVESKDADVNISRRQQAVAHAIAWAMELNWASDHRLGGCLHGLQRTGRAGKTDGKPTARGDAGRTLRNTTCRAAFAAQVVRNVG